MNSLQFLESHCEFKESTDCYVLLAVSRKRDTSSMTSNQEIVFREVIKGKEDIAQKYNKIKSLCESYRCDKGKKYPFYLYVSVNARCARKACFMLFHKFLKWFEEEKNGVDHSRQILKVNGHFVSCLMEKGAKSKSTKYFMIDYDKKNCLNLFINALESKGVKVFLTRETVHGFHFKVSPFDVRLLPKEDYFEVKKDANFFVEYINGDI